MDFLFLLRGNRCQYRVLEPNRVAGTVKIRLVKGGWSNEGREGLMCGKQARNLWERICGPHPTPLQCGLTGAALPRRTASLLTSLDSMTQRSRIPNRVLLCDDGSLHCASYRAEWRAEKPSLSEIAWLSVRGTVYGEPGIHAVRVLSIHSFVISGLKPARATATPPSYPSLGCACILYFGPLLATPPLCVQM